MTHTRLTDNLAHAFYFLPPLQGNERSLVAFLSWPYELTNAKTFFLNFIISFNAISVGV